MISGPEIELLAVPTKLKAAIVPVERRKRIFLYRIPTIQLHMEQDNLKYAESHTEWETEEWEMLHKYQKWK
ncbi:hypothetical protein ABVT39_008630, partial [Epinephelus coioides]